jgi:choice-of-anchor B domain-containing protein
VNIQDPLNPIGEGGYSGSGYTHDAQVVVYDGPDSDYTGKEIYIGSNEDKVVIVDVTDKTNPVLISAVTYTNDAYTHQGWFTEDLTYFIVGDEIDELNFGFNTRNIVFDFTDLDNPQLSFEYSGPTSATDHNGYVDGDKFYLANYKAGMRVIDISDISNENMTEIGFFDVFPSNNTAGYDGAWNVYPYFASGNILISSLKYSSPDYVPGFYLVKSSTLSVDDNFLSNFSLYPNPSTNSVKLSSTNTPISEISIYDLSGKLLLSKKYNSEININLNISNLGAGIYLLKINNKKSIKLIKN